MHEIGMKNRPMSLFEIDEDYLRTSDEFHGVEISLHDELD